MKNSSHVAPDMKAIDAYAPPAEEDPAGGERSTGHAPLRRPQSWRENVGFVMLVSFVVCGAVPTYSPTALTITFSLTLTWATWYLWTH